MPPPVQPGDSAANTPPGPSSSRDISIPSSSQPSNLYQSSSNGREANVSHPQEMIGEDNGINKRMAVVCKAIDGLTLDDYLLALINIVEPIDITHASRISHNRICIYLRSIPLADKVASSPPLTQKGKQISYQKYVRRATRIFLTNVIPDIPESTLRDHLSQFGRVVGQITFLKATYNSHHFAHVKGFRRVANVVVEDLATIPISIPVSYAGNTYTIYLSLNDHTCATCGMKGHHQAQCSATQPTPIQKTPADATTNMSPTSATVTECLTEPVITAVTPVTHTMEAGPPLATVTKSSSLPAASEEVGSEERLRHGLCPPSTSKTSPTALCFCPSSNEAALFQGHQPLEILQPMATEEDISKELKSTGDQRRSEVEDFVHQETKRQRVSRRKAIKHSPAMEVDGNLSPSTSNKSEAGEISASSEEPLLDMNDNLYTQAWMNIPVRKDKIPQLLGMGIDPVAFLKTAEHNYNKRNDWGKKEGTGKRLLTLITRLRAEIGSKTWQTKPEVAEYLKTLE